ncbi:MAG: hypothetical protein EPN79_16210 [Burkholderiaceae bacterium]|nr:MAG: hypothetical protein EPN79_16210 [Burkholderiaceae bacterium]
MSTSDLTDKSRTSSTKTSGGVNLLVARKPEAPVTVNTVKNVRTGKTLMFAGGLPGTVIVPVSTVGKTGKGSRRDEIVKARVAPELKEEATAFLRGYGLTISDLLRETLVLTVSAKKLPFAVRNRTGGVLRPELKKQLADMHLPELHATRWAERAAQLEAQLDRAERDQDAELVASTEEALAEHYKHEFDVEQTRRALMEEQADAEALPSPLHG